jgi:rubrerythrin
MWMPCYISSHIDDIKEQKSMQEQRSTTVSNTYYNLVSVLYHALETAQTTSAYIQDAQQSGNQDLANFFREIQQTANSQANRARQLLSQTK